MSHGFKSHSMRWSVPGRRQQLLFVAAFVALPFLPVLSNGFVNWDDQINFTRNYHFRGLSWSNLEWAFTTVLLGVYQPLAWAILEVQYAIWGLSPWGYHLVSLILHCANSAILAVLIANMLRRCVPVIGEGYQPQLDTAATIAALLHGVHPLRVEPVAWASCQPYLPCATLMMLAMLAYLRSFPANGVRRKSWVLVAWFLLLAALLCKAVAMTFPAILVILNVYPLKRLGGGKGRWFGPAVRWVWLEILPFALLGLVFASIALTVRDEGLTISLPGQLSLDSRVVRACYGLCFYLIRSAYPARLCAFYPCPSGLTMLSMPYLGCLITVVAVTAVAFLRRRESPGLLAAWASYVVLLAPNLGLSHASPSIVSDRYSYVSTMGWFIVLAYLLLSLDARLRPVGYVRPAWMCGGALLAILLVATLNQCRAWRDDTSLWRQAYSCGGSENCRVVTNLAISLFKKGRYDEAMVLSQKAELLDPEYEDGFLVQGKILAEQGQFESAVSRYNKALLINPKYGAVHNDLGLALANLGRFDDALKSFQTAIELSSGSAKAHVNLAQLLALKGKYQDSLNEYELALALEPDNARARRGVSEILGSLRKPR